MKLPKWAATWGAATNTPGINVLDQVGMGAESGFRGVGQGNLADKIWGRRGTTVQADNFDKNAALQKEFAQNSLKWKMDDARRAGVHPVYALGASGTSFSPMYSAGSTELQNENQWMADVGQSIVGAQSRTATAEQRQAAQLNLEGMQLDNDLKRSQLRQLNSPGAAGPGDSAFIEGQGNSGVKVQSMPMQRTTSMGGRPDLEPGAKTGTGFYVQKGSQGQAVLVPVPSKDTKESIEDNMFHEAAHFWRNNVSPNLPFTTNRAPPGYRWDYSEQGYVKEDRKDPKYWKDYGPPRRGGK